MMDTRLRRFACAIKYNPPSIRSTKLKLSNDPTVLEYHRSILTTIQTTCHLSYHEQKAKQSHSVTDMSKKTSNSIVCLCQRLLHGLRHRAQMPRTLFRIFTFTSLCHHAAILSAVINILMFHTDAATCKIQRQQMKTCFSMDKNIWKNKTCTRHMKDSHWNFTPATDAFRLE